MNHTNKIIIKSAGVKISGDSAAHLLKKIDYLSREIGPVKVSNNSKQTGTKIILDIGSTEDGNIVFCFGNGVWEKLDDNDEIFYLMAGELY